METIKSQFTVRHKCGYSIGGPVCIVCDQIADRGFAALCGGDTLVSIIY